MNPIKNVSLGFGFLFSGILFIKSHRELWLWALIPFIIELVLLLLFLSWGFTNLSVWVAGALSWAFSNPSGWLYMIFYYPMYLIFSIGFTVMLIFMVYLIGTVIASPFNAVLAEKTLILNGAIKDHPFIFLKWVKISVKMFLVALTRTIIFGLIGIVLFFMSFVPILNLLSAYLAFIILALDSMDYSYEVAGLGLKARFQHFRDNITKYMGMGGAVGLTLFIPGLTLLLLPASVVGAANIFSQEK